MSGWPLTSEGSHQGQGPSDLLFEAVLLILKCFEGRERAEEADHSSQAGGCLLAGPGDPVSRSDRDRNMELHPILHEGPTSPKPDALKEELLESVATLSP